MELPIVRRAEGLGGASRLLKQVVLAKDGVTL